MSGGGEGSAAAAAPSDSGPVKHGTWACAWPWPHPSHAGCSGGLEATDTTAGEG